MADSLDLSVSEARRIVLSLSRRAGWVEPEARVGADPRLLESYAALRQEFGDILEIITTEIYARKSRFILELIQNVEDCRFERTDSVPSISFEVSPERIIIESNEDGFTENDVRQICRTGRSWKRQQRGYVGDKGIGFKSVFQVASKVKIQSNSFSFSFEYNGGATGEEKLGIITPITEDDPVPLNERPLTRMTLTPNNTPYEELVAHFETIHISLLLFLSTIQEISIKIHRPGQAITTTIFRKSEDAASNLTILTTIIVEGEVDPRETVTDTSRYRIFRNTITGLPDDDARPGINECDVVLAFPVDELDNPLKPTRHDIFAFLPVGTIGLNFLIQADFILQASREEIMFDSNWNKAILGHIATTFSNAVFNFSRGESNLRFQWVKYLPDGRALNMNQFWKRLSTAIIELLKQKDILYVHNSVRVCPPGEVRTLLATYLDRNRSPLFRDREGRHGKYLSLEYDPEDIETLKRMFEIQDLEDLAMCHRISQDLESSDSKMKSDSTDDDWHSRAANLISSILARRCSDGVRTYITRCLPLIPLNDRRWVCGSDNGSYFPSETGPAIPQDLLVTIRSEAIANRFRRKLFRELGAAECEPRTVVEKLWLSYSRQGGAVDLASSKAHLSYLYWNYENVSDRRFLYLWIYDGHRKRVTSRQKIIYLPSEDEYGPQELFKSVRYRSRVVPELEVSFLNLEYMRLFPPSVRRYERPWLSWLKIAVGVRDVPRLAFEAGSLSTEFRHILRNRPEKIIGALKKYWPTYRTQINSAIIDEISTATVTCWGVPSVALKSTYYPTLHLKTEADALGIVKGFPFLTVPASSDEGDVSEDWRFLERFQVRFESSISFYLDILIQHESRRQKVWSDEARADILRTYAKIADHCSEINKESLLETFHRENLILDPCSFVSGSTGPSWIDIDSCIWKGPENVLDKTPLASAPQYRTDRKLTRLFHEILGIQNSNWKDYERTLQKLKTNQDLSIDIPDRVLKLYKLFSETNINDGDWDTIRNTFEREGLIYIPSTSEWSPPSQCLWSSPVPIDGKAIIGSDYPQELRIFFLTRLRISPASLATLVEGLSNLSERNASLPNVKQTIRAINAMNPVQADLESLKICRVLPVRGPGSADNISLRRVEDNFAVIDRVKLAEIFQGHVGLLDFSLEEVRQLDPFLQALGLNKKFLSQLCAEDTTCGEDGVVDERLTSEFKDRAYDFLRCAVSFRSPPSIGTPRMIYDGLLASSVLKSNTISTQYTLQHANGDITGPIAHNIGYVHVRYQESGWQIFVPRDNRNREVCYRRNLPEALTKLLRISTSARETISNVLNSSSFIIDDLLDAAGIGKVPGIQPPVRNMAEVPEEQEELIAEEQGEVITEEQEEIIAEEATSSERGSRAQSTPLQNDGQPLNQPGPSNVSRQDGMPSAPDVIAEGSSRASRLPLGPQVSRAGTVISEDDSVPASSVPTPQDSPEPRIPRQDRVPAQGLRQNVFGNFDAYRDLLDNVIRIASRANLPHRDFQAEPINGEFLQGFDHEAAFGVRSRNQMGHDMKIGAAGELFAFEVLLNAFPRSFGRDNWRSTIRREVTVHPAYSDMQPWNFRETADIVYPDVSSQLTRMLIRLGYLENVWTGATPEYLIEVKTTTGACSDRFFMSSNQYRMMQDFALRPGQISGTIYIVFRVFNLGKESLGMKLYIDPEAHRQRDALLFETQGWTVTPAPLQ